MPPLPETLLAWLDEGAEAGVYALTRGKLVYANATFRALLDEAALDLTELVGRSPSSPAPALRRGPGVRLCRNRQGLPCKPHRMPICGT